MILRRKAKRFLYEEAASFGTRRTFLLESERQFRFFDRARNQDKNYSRACQKADSFLNLIDSPNVLEKDIVVDEGGPPETSGEISEIFRRSHLSHDSLNEFSEVANLLHFIHLVNDALDDF